MEDSMRNCLAEQMLAEASTPLTKGRDGEEAAEYYIETMTECNLRCGLCALGSKELFDHKKEVMEPDLFERIVKKIASVSPHALVGPYHQNEPLLHPKLPEMIGIIKKYGLTSRIATNLNIRSLLPEILEAGIDSISISVSGFYQDTYQKSHTGGNIEKVKENMRYLRNLMDSNGKNPDVSINYHMYKDNLGEEFDMMRQLSDELGFYFAPSWARTINGEMSLKYLREKGLSRYHGETLPWFDELPPLTEAFYRTIERIVYLPEDYLHGKFERVHENVCPVNEKIINIRCNGKLSLCCDVFDDRLITEYDYLDTPVEKLYQLRKEHPLCKECLANNYAFYSNYVDMIGIDELAASRLDENIPDDRRFFSGEEPEYRRISNFCDSHKHVFIYGAGKNGRQLEAALRKQNVGFECFLVSDSHISEFDEKNVKPLSSIKGLAPATTGVIVAMNKTNTDEVRKTLLDMGIDVCFAAQKLFLNSLK